MHCFSAFFILKEFLIMVKKTAVNPLRKKLSPFWVFFFFRLEHIEYFFFSNLDGDTSQVQVMVKFPFFACHANLSFWKDMGW